MLLTILGVIAALIVVLVVVVSMRPTEFTVERKGTMRAAPETVHALVNNFHEWPKWSPWEKRDPNLKRDFSGPDAGTGAHYHWVGNNQVGEGRMTITESQTGKLIRIKLEFIKPFAGVNTTDFTFTPQDGGTLVTWTMKGNNNFMAKAMGLFMNMDKMIGGDFEKGLADMKKAAEGSTAG